MRRLGELLLESADRGLDLQDRATGAMPAGRNGPHGDPETAVRTTAHWLQLFGHAHDVTGRPAHRDAAQRCLRFLLSDRVRPAAATFDCRRSPGKDAANGLIGQAWAIEGLLAGHQLLDDDEALQTALEVFDLHPQDPTTGLWKTVEVGGSALGIDVTFNHQLWFAATGARLARLAGDPGVATRVARFHRTLPTHLAVRRNGLVRHRLLRATGWPRDLYRLVRASIAESPRLRREREIGYQAFNLYALATAPWPGPLPAAVARAVDAIRRPAYAAALETSRFGYGYNPPGFEVPVVLARLGSAADEDAAAVWIRRQVRRTWDHRRGLFARGTPDPVTLAARAYEATRLPRRVLELD